MPRFSTTPTTDTYRLHRARQLYDDYKRLRRELLGRAFKKSLAPLSPTNPDEDQELYAELNEIREALDTLLIELLEEGIL